MSQDDARSGITRLAGRWVGRAHHNLLIVEWVSAVAPDTHARTVLGGVTGLLDDFEMGPGGPAQRAVFCQPGSVVLA